MGVNELDYKMIGQRIRAERNKKGWQQAELAFRAGMTAAHLSHIETAQCKVSLNMMLKIAYALDTGLDYFLLDTPFACPESIIDTEIADKLKNVLPPRWSQ